MKNNNFCEALKNYFDTTPREKVLEDWAKSAEHDKIGVTVEEFLDNTNQQETLEEAAEKYCLINSIPIDQMIVKHDRSCEFETPVTMFIKGAKWQAERMYSEEDMVKFAEFVATYLDKNRNVNGEMLHAKSKYDGAERTIDLLKQFKKK